MFKKNYILLFFIIVGIFVSYVFLEAMVSKSILKMDGYDLKVKGMNIDRHPPFFKPISKYDDVSTFFIHPSVELPAKGIFTFNKHFLLGWAFSIQEGSPSGDIEFTVKKNGKVFDKFIVTTKVKHQVKISVDEGDKVEIIADMHGSTSGDWGNLKISKYTSNYILKPQLSHIDFSKFSY